VPWVRFEVNIPRKKQWIIGVDIIQRVLTFIQDGDIIQSDLPIKDGDFP
jgi:hypothetical protein